MALVCVIACQREETCCLIEREAQGPDCQFKGEHGCPVCFSSACPRACVCVCACGRALVYVCNSFVLGCNGQHPSFSNLEDRSASIGLFVLRVL